MIDTTALADHLGKKIAEILRARAPEFKKHRLGGLALSAAPWHNYAALSVLIETDIKYRKWFIGDWEHNEFAEFVYEDLPKQAYDELQDPNGKGSLYAPFFRFCAQALCHKAVKAALQLYNLEPDFELFVDDPDDPNHISYCEEILGVNKKTRKPTTTIVGNLDEALKDHSTVLKLTYSFQGKFAKTADASISQLKNLEILSLEFMGLKRLPKCVLALIKLKELVLDRNQITSLTGLRDLKKLEMLSLRFNGNMTKAMHNEIAEITALKSLRVGDCGLKEVPESWQQLRALEEIYIFDNPLSSLPEWVCALPNLKRLGLVKVVNPQTKGWLRKRHPQIEIW